MQLKKKKINLKREGKQRTFCDYDPATTGSVYDPTTHSAQHSIASYLWRDVCVYDVYAVCAETEYTGNNTAKKERMLYVTVIWCLC